MVISPEKATRRLRVALTADSPSMANALRFSLEGTCGLLGGARRVAITADRGGDEGGDSGVAVRLERAGETEARRVGAEAEGASLLLPPAAAPRRRSCELDCSGCSV